MHIKNREGREDVKTTIDKDNYDTCVEPSDWRYSATIVGLIKYFVYFNISYDINATEGLEFKYDDITRSKYLEFAESYYSDEFYHFNLQQILSQEEFTEERIKLVNEKLAGNTIMKKVFPKIKFDGSNKDQILQIIGENRETLICETFRNKSNMYANYANTYQLFEEPKTFCRLVGYCIDAGKKGKSAAYLNDMNTFVGQDDPLFDFIPFAFTGNREAFFINSNYKIKDLCESNNRLANKAREDLRAEGKENSQASSDVRKVLFKTIQESADFIDYDVEVIFKNRDNGFFETLYIRKESIEVLEKIKDYQVFCFHFKMNDNYYINVQKKVTDCILNLIFVDELIELFLKDKTDMSYVIKKLIGINVLIRGGKVDMTKGMQGAYACAKKVSEKIPGNKIDSYRQKLTSAIVFKDYDRVCQILLQLSNYADIPFDFALQLFENFEEHKEIAYTFINTLRKPDKGGNAK